MLENNASVQKRRNEHQSIKLVQTLVLADERINVQKTNIQRLNIDVTKWNMVSELNDRINEKKFRDVLGQRYQPDPIMKVKRSKPKDESLKIHLVWKKEEYEYTKVVFACELVKYNYIDWIQI